MPSIQANTGKENKMEPKVITTKKEYEESFAEVERLIALDPKPRTPNANRLNLFAMIVKNYEKERFPIGKPDSIEAIKFRMEEQGLKQRDLIPYLGSKSKVSEILSGKRPLTVQMIRALNKGLDIPSDILLQNPKKKLPQTRKNAKNKTILSAPLPV